MRLNRLAFIFFYTLYLVVSMAANAQLKVIGLPANPERKAIDRLATVIQYQTVSAVHDKHHNASEFLALHEYLKGAFPLVHRHLQKEVVNNYSLLYTWPGKDASLSPILISAHLDVVPVEGASEASWKVSPFSGTVQNGYVWGRGTMDDKYRVVAVLEAVERLLEDGFQPSRTLLLAFGHDEEVGGHEGAGRISELLQKRRVQLEAVFDEGLAVTEHIIPGIEEQLAFVGTAAKGNLNLKLTVNGQGGHSSAPPAHTPIEVLSRAIVRLQQNPFKPRMIPTTRETVAILAERMGGKYKFAVRNYGLFRNRILKKLGADQATDALIRTKMTPTILEAGDKYNVLPTVASAVINIRILNGEDKESVFSHVERAIADDRVKIDVYGNYTPPSQVTRTDTWTYTALQHTITAIYPEAVVVPALFPGATDSKHYASLTNNIFRFAPQLVTRESAKLVHNVNERISVEVFGKCIRFYEVLIQRTCGTDEAGELVSKSIQASDPVHVGEK